MHLLFRLNKGKGILVILYLIVSLLATAELVGILHRNIGGIFSKIDFYTTVGISFAIAGLSFRLFAKLKEVADVVCCAEGFVARHHQHQFEAIAQFISLHPMFYKTKFVFTCCIKFSPLRTSV